MSRASRSNCESLPGPIRRIDSLTSMRFLAAALIVAQHLEGHLGVPDGAMPLRRIGVSFFFVLSGFVLTYVYGQPGRRVEARSFYWRRFLRLYPLHWAVAVLALVLDWSRVQRFFEQTPAMATLHGFEYLALVQTWIPGSEVLIFNGVTWSMSVLVAFYLVFPWLLRQKYLAVWWLVSVVAVTLGIMGLGYLVCAGWWAWSTSVDVVHFFPPFRACEFLIGMWAAKHFPRVTEHPALRALWDQPRLASVLDVMLIVTCLGVWHVGAQHIAGPAQSGLMAAAWVSASPALFVDNPTLEAKAARSASADTAEREGTVAASQRSGFVWVRGRDSWLRTTLRLTFRWWGYAGFGIPAALLVVWLARSTGVVSGWLRHPWLIYLGQLSFAIYLCHRPLMLWVEQTLVPTYLVPGLPAVAFAIGLTLIVSMILYHGVELPTSRLGRAKPRTHLRGFRVEKVARGAQPARGAYVMGLVSLSILISSAAWGWAPARSSTETSPGLQAASFLGRAVQGHFANDCRVTYNLATRGGRGRLQYQWESASLVPGRLMLHFVNSSGDVLDRMVVEVRSADALMRAVEVSETRLFELQAHPEIAYVRLSFLRDSGGLVRVSKGHSDRWRRGLVVWVAPDLADAARRHLFPPEIDERNASP